MDVWTYSGVSWVKQTGGAGQPESLPYVGEVWGNPTPSSIVLRDNTNALWTYDGLNWVKQSGGVNQPPSVVQVFGNNTSPSSIVMSDGSQLWTYNGTQWESQTGGINQPVSSYPFVYGNPTPISITMEDDSGILWVYNGSMWESQTGNTNQPANYGFVIGYPVPTSIVMIDNPNNLWTYNGTSWQKLTGGVNQPNGVSLNMFPPAINQNNATSANIIMQDSLANLWSYNGITWVQLTGLNANQAPSSFYSHVLNNNPTPTSLFWGSSQFSSQLMDLWTYNGTSWQKLTGGSDQPSAVFYYNNSIGPVGTGLVSTQLDDIPAPSNLSSGLFTNVAETINFAVITDPKGHLWMYNSK